MYLFLAIAFIVLALVLITFRLVPIPYGEWQTTPWHFWIVMGIFTTYSAVEDYWRHVERRMPVLESRWIIHIVAAALFWLYAVMAFRKQRPQFSIRSLLIVTLVVAMLCSATHYIGRDFVLAACFMLYFLVFSVNQGFTRLKDASKRLRQLKELQTSPLDLTPNDDAEMSHRNRTNAANSEPQVVTEPKQISDIHSNITYHKTPLTELPNGISGNRNRLKHPKGT